MRQSPHCSQSQIANRKSPGLFKPQTNFLIATAVLSSGQSPSGLWKDSAYAERQNLVRDNADLRRGVAWMLHHALCLCRIGRPAICLFLAARGCDDAE